MTILIFLSVDIIDLKTIDDQFKKIVNAQKILLFKDKTSLDVTSRDNPVYLNNMITVTRGRSYKSSELQENTECALVTLKSFARGGQSKKELAEDEKKNTTNPSVKFESK